MNLLLELQNYCFANNFAGNLHVRCVPIEWIDTFPDYAQHGHNFSTAITLKPGKSWMMLPCVSDSIAFQERERDTKHGPMCLPTVTGFIANDTPNIAAVTNFMRAKEWIVAVIYKTGETKVIGSPDTPARFSSSFVNGRRLSDSKGYEIEFNSASEVKSFFLENEPEVSACLPVVVSLNSQEVAAVPSGQNVNIPVRTESGDAVGVYDDELGVWVVPDAPVCEDVDLEINGTPEGSFTAGSTIDLQLTDGVNPVTPVSVGRVGNTVTATLPAASTGWVRNPDWLPLPEITAADNRFVGLFLVFENEYNQNVISMSGTSYSLNVDWGDGTSQVVTTNTTISKVYDYATITSPVKQYYDGRNYKQVIVDAQLNSGVLIAFSPGAQGTINNPGKRNYCDIAMSFPNAITSFISGGNFAIMVYLERLRFINHAITGINNYQTTILNALRVLEFKTSGILSLNARFTFLGECDLGDFIADQANDGSAFQQVFLSSRIKSVGNVSGALAPNAVQMFRLCSGLQTIGDVNLPLCTNANNFASESQSLRKVGAIYAPLLQNITSFFSNCYSLEEAEFSSCSAINTTTAAFNGCRSLRKLTMTGLTVGFSIAQCNLTAQAINDLFNSLGTAAGSQTIIVTGNPGAATCDTTIATAKGYTVTT